MTSGPQPLSRETRSFIVLIALSQGLLLWLAQTGQAHHVWPFSELGGCICWYTLVLGVPSAMTLTVARLRDARYWQNIAIVGVVLALLAAWATWSATGAPGLRSSEVLGPYGATTILALFVALPWLQCRIERGRWYAPYTDLFEHAWQNALTLALTLAFVGICWAVLQLWAELFALVKIEFFRDLFREPAFVYLATGGMAGLGILIARTQEKPIRIARQVVLAVFTGLLPLIAFVAVLFAVSLVFTGLEPLWKTRHAAMILMWLVATMIVFANAVHQDGRNDAPYPAWLRRVIDAGLLSLPIFAAIALYALHLRIGPVFDIDRFGERIFDDHGFTRRHDDRGRAGVQVPGGGPRPVRLRAAEMGDLDAFSRGRIDRHDRTGFPRRVETDGEGHPAQDILAVLSLMYDAGDLTQASEKVRCCRQLLRHPGILIS